MRDIYIGLLGFGNIGNGVFKIINESKEQILHRDKLNIIIKKILIKDKTKKRNLDFIINEEVFTDKIEDIVNDADISIVVEVMGGVNPAKDYIIKSLEKSKTVVTANKEVLAQYWHEFDKIAKKNKIGLFYEASVAGGIPIIKVLSESMQANKIYEVFGIINGTTNYILTKMSRKGIGYNEVLKDAQKLGFAEPNPYADVSGLDATYKLSILSTLAFHAKVPLDMIYREGISEITIDDIGYGKELGYEIKLLAIAKKENEVIEVRVHPTFIPKDHPLASVSNEYNAVFLKGDRVGNLMLYGRGAGQMPTGSAVISDIISATKFTEESQPTFENFEFPSNKIRFNDNWMTSFFIRMTVKDKPGVLSSISGIFGENSVSISKVIQKGHDGETAPLIFITHKASKTSMEKAVKKIKENENVIKIENVIRVEED